MQEKVIGMKDHVQPLKKHKENDHCTSLPAFAWLLLLFEAAEYPLQENDSAVVELVLSICMRFTVFE